MHVKTCHVRWEYSYSRSLSTYKGGRSLEKHDFWRPLEPHKRSLRPQQSNVRRRSWPCRGVVHTQEVTTTRTSDQLDQLDQLDRTRTIAIPLYHCSSLLISSISSIYAKDMPKICQSPDSDREGPNHLFSNGKSPLPKVNHAQLEWRSFWCCRCKTWFSMGSRTSYTWILDLQVQMFLQNNRWNLICFSNFRIFRPTHQKNVNRACLHSGLRRWFEPHRWEETVDLFTIKNKAKDKNKYHKTQYCNGL